MKKSCVLILALLLPVSSQAQEMLPTIIPNTYFERSSRVAEDHAPLLHLQDMKIQSALRVELTSYQKIKEQGGWPQLPARKISLGQSDPAIALLRQRLGIETGATPELFDDQITQALIVFQKAHGMEPDGKLGPKTRTALNMSVEKRIAQLLVNLERLRWGSVVPASGKAVVVNIPQYQLTAYDNLQPALVSKVIVGKPARKTPILASEINQLVLNPQWVAPPTIMAKDILPHLRDNPETILRKGYQVSYQGEAVDVYDVDWTTVSTRDFSSFRVSAPPGDKNPLGRVRFTLPDTGSIYLHDTGSRDLFAKDSRALSSGCVRVQAWRELADFVTAANSTIDSQRIDQILDKTNTSYAKLNAPVPVYFIYQTAWLDDEGRLVMGEDIYGYDQKLYREMIKQQSEPHPLKTAFLM